MSLFNELKKRNVFRVGLAYVISAWVIAQVVDLVLDGIKAPDWVMQALLLGLGLGFIAALIIAWAYELTPEGIKREKDVVRDDSITNITAKKLDYITLFAALGVLAIFVYQQLNPAFVNQVVEDKPIKTESSINHAKDKRADPTLPKAQTPIETSNKSIAILPFVNMSNDPSQEYFSDGITEEILNVLVKNNQLLVAARTSAFAYKGKNIGGCPR